jgi:hypothetical protein
MVCFFNCSSKKNPSLESLSNVDTINNSNVDSIYSIINHEKLDIDSFPNFHIDYTFKYGKLKYLVGRYIHTPVDLAENDVEGLRLLVLDLNNKLVFRSLGAGDSYNMSATMYKLDNTSPIFILSEYGDESGSWGNAVFMVRNDVVEEIGFIDLGIRIKDETDPYPSFYFEDIGDYTRIVKRGGTYHFIFDVDSVCVKPNSQNERILNGREVSYVYANNDFRLIEK